MFLLLLCGNLKDLKVMKPNIGAGVTRLRHSYEKVTAFSMRAHVCILFFYYYSINQIKNIFIFPIWVKIHRNLVTLLRNIYLCVILISVVYIFLRGCEHEYTQKNTVNAT